MAIMLKFEEREVGKVAAILVPLAALGLAFLVGAFMMLWAGVNPIAGYTAFLLGALGSPGGITDTLLRMTPFLLMGVGIAFSNRAGVLNIGAEGQYIMGAIAATWVTLALQYVVPAPISVTAAVIAAAIVGSAWATFAGALKAYMGVNEIVTTVIMNWLALRILQWLLRGPLKSPTAQQWPVSPPLKAVYPPIIPEITLRIDGIMIHIPGIKIHIGFLIAILAAIASYYLLFHTNTGFKLRVAGQNPAVATYAGYRVKTFFLLSMALSGGMAGLAGAGEVLGMFQYLYEGIAVGLGYTAIIVALVGKNHPIGVIFSAFMFGIIYNGMTYLQGATGLAYTFSKALEGMIYIFVLLAEVLIIYRIRVIRVGGE